MLGSLDQFVALAPNAMAIFDREMRYIAASRRWLADYRLTQTPLGRSHYDVFPEITEGWKGVHRLCLAGATESSDGDRFERADGAIQWVKWETRPWFDDDGAIGGIVIASEDITARVEAQQRAEDLARRLSAAVAELEATARRAQEAERRLRDALNAIPGGFAVYDADDRLVVANEASRGMHPRIADGLRPGGSFEGFLRLGLERGEFGLGAADKETWLRESMERHRNPAGSTEQLSDAGRWLRLEECRTPDGGAVVIRTDITDLKNRECELARKTAVLEATLHAMGEGILVYGADRKLLVVNDKTAQLLDPPAALLEPGASHDALNRFCAERGDFGEIDPDEAVHAMVASFQQRKSWNRTQRDRNGRILEVRFSPMSDGGGVFTLLDVTAAALREDNLAEKTALLEATLRNTGEGIAAFDADRRLLVVNEFALQIVELPLDLIRPDVLYDDILRFLATTDPDGATDVETFVDVRVAQFRAQEPFVVRRRLNDGRVIETRFNPTPSGGGVYLYRDVTERAEYEAKLAEKTELLEAALENMGEGISVFGPDLKLMIRNETAARVLELTPALLKQPAVSLEDVMRFRAERGDFGDGDVQSLVERRVARFRAQRPWSETRRRPDGRAFETRFNPTPMGGGVFMFRDVTERADAEARLAEKTALLEAIRRNMGEGIAVYDADRTLLVGNEIVALVIDVPAVLFKPGATLDALIRFRVGRGDYGEVDPDAAVREGIVRFQARRPWTKVRRRPDGRTIETRFSPMPNGVGVFVFRDVTKRADAEAKLAEKTALLEATLENIGEGVAVYGPDFRLRTCNAIAVQLLEAPAALMQPGVSSFEDVMRFRIARGDFGDLDADLLAREKAEQLHAQACASRTLKFRSGRVVEVRCNPYPDGGAVYVLRDVTERAEYETKLAEKTAVLEATLENIGEGVSVYGPDLRLKMCNEIMARIIGAPPGLLRPGVSHQDVIRFRAQRGELGDIDVDTAIRERGARFRARKPLVETRATCDGRVIEARINLTPDGGAIYVVRDVTERAEYEAKLDEKNRLLEATFENMGQGITVFGPDLKLRTCNEYVAQMAGEEGSLLQPGVSLEDVARFRALSTNYADGATEAYVAEKVAEFRAQRPWSRTYTIHDGRVIEARFNPLPDRGGIFLFRDVSERERAEARIREEEAKFRSLVEMDVAGIVIVRDDVTVGYCNSFMANMVGYAAEEIVGRPLLDFVPETERPNLVRIIKTQLSGVGEPVQIAMKVRARNGSILEVLVNASRSTFEGRRARIAVVVDVTARNRAERELASAAAILAAIHESSPDGILVVDPAGRILSANRRFGEMFDFRAELLPAGDGTPLLALASRQVADPGAFRRRMQYLFDHPDESGHDEVAVKDGRVFDRLTSPLKTVDGKRLGRIWFFRDITARRKAEGSLRASEERFRMLIEEAPDAIVLFDCDQDRCVAANKAAERLFGVPREEIVEQGPQRFYTPEQPDALPVARSYSEHNKRALAGEEVTFERRIRQPSGEERVCRITLVRLPSEVSLLRASMLDVTEQRAAEAKLAEVQRNIVIRQESERQKIARELHDSLGQYLAAMNMKIGVLDQSVAEAAPVRAGLADLKNLTATVGKEVSRLAWELRPIALDDIGLEPAIQHFVEEWARRSGLRFDLHLALKDRRLPPNVETTLYRVLQEGITNVVKHARAKSVGVILKASPNDVVLIIEDDGIGFASEEVRRSSSARLGLLGIRERLAAIRGGLEIETTPGRGTTLIIRVSLNDRAAV